MFTKKPALGVTRQPVSTPITRIDRRSFLLAAGLGLCGAVSNAQVGGSEGKPGVEPWSRFLGPGGTGVAGGTGYPAEIGPKTLLWKTQVPSGKSSPVVTDKLIFLTGQTQPNSLEVIALDRATGQVLWNRAKVRLRQTATAASNSPASPTPVTDGRNVYAFFGDVGLVSYDSTGEERWHTPLGPFAAGWGVGGSPILVDNLVILQADGYNNSFIAAYDRDSGKEVWRSARADMAQNYSTPIVRTRKGGRKEVLALGPNAVVAYDVRNGEASWHAPGPMGSIVGSLAVHKQMLIMTNYAFEGGYTPSFDVRLKEFDKDGDGAISPQEAANAGQWGSMLAGLGTSFGNKDGRVTRDKWMEGVRALSGKSLVTAVQLAEHDGVVESDTKWSYDRSVPHSPSPLIYQDALYLVATGGVMTSMDPSTGRVGKQARLPGGLGSYFSSPVAADGKLYALSESGTLFVVKTGLPDWEVLSSTAMPEGSYSATPALDSGQVLIRSDTELSCFGAPLR